MSPLDRLHALALAALLAFAPTAQASQASIVTPQTGPHSMADFTTNYLNPALQAMASCFSGPSAPNDGPGGVPVQYQCWADTSASPATYRFYDGASWVAFGTLNTATHVWTARSGAVNSQTANYSIQASDCGGIVQAGTGSTGVFAITLPSVSGFPSSCLVTIVNGDSARWKTLSGFPAGAPASLYPLQAIVVAIVNGAWANIQLPGRFEPSASSLIFYVNADGANPQTCGQTGALTCGAGSDSTGDGSQATPWQTLNHACSVVNSSVDPFGQLIVINLAHGSSTNYGNASCYSNGPLPSSTTIVIQGDDTSPTSVTILSPNAGFGVFVKDYTFAQLRSLTIGDQGASLYGVLIGQFGGVDFKNVHFGTFNSSAYQIEVYQHASGNLTSGVSGGPSATLDGGGAAAFLYLQDGGVFGFQTANGLAPTHTQVSIPSALSYTNFVKATGPSALFGLNASTFTGAGVPGTTGVRALLSGPGFMEASGVGCNSVFPGNSNCQLRQGFQDDAGDVATTAPPGIPSTTVFVGRQTFCNTASGCTSNSCGAGCTYSPDTGTNVVDVQCVAGGGGGGGCAATGAGQGCIGGAGGAGSYSRRRIAASFSGVTVTAGAPGAAGAAGANAGGVGGNSSFGSLLSVIGGSAGPAGSAASVGTITLGSGGSTPPTLGDINIVGTSSADTPLQSTSAVQQAFPAGSFFGPGSRVKATATTANGTAATSPGAGATGAASAASQAAAAGAAGGQGMCIVDEYQ